MENSRNTKQKKIQTHPFGPSTALQLKVFSVSGAVSRQPTFSSAANGNVHRPPSF